MAPRFRTANIVPLRDIPLLSSFARRLPWWLLLGAVACSAVLLSSPGWVFSALAFVAMCLCARSKARVLREPVRRLDGADLPSKLMWIRRRLFGRTLISGCFAAVALMASLSRIWPVNMAVLAVIVLVYGLEYWRHRQDVDGRLKWFTAVQLATHGRSSDKILTTQLERQLVRLLTERIPEPDGSSWLLIADAQELKKPAVLAEELNVNVQVVEDAYHSLLGDLLDYKGQHGNSTWTVRPRLRENPDREPS